MNCIIHEVPIMSLLLRPRETFEITFMCKVKNQNTKVTFKFVLAEYLLSHLSALTALCDLDAYCTMILHFI